MQHTRTFRTTTNSVAAHIVRDQLMAELRREEITARIKEARIEAGLSQTDMADLLDVAPRTYQNYEASRVPWGLIDRIATATGKDSAWLLHGQDVPIQQPTADLLSQLQRIESKLDRLLGTTPDGKQDVADAAAQAGHKREQSRSKREATGRGRKAEGR